VKIIMIILILVILYLGFLLSEKSPYNTEPFGGMKEYANLQNIHDGMGTSKELTKKFKIVTYNGSRVLIFKEEGCGVLLNCEYPPYYKRFGSCKNISLTLDEFKLIGKQNVAVTVLDILSESIVSSTNPKIK